jgi:choline dehydrogenase-like flavoprotein
MMIVVGSGPAGVAAAMGLVQRGCSVTMLDAGLTLEDSRAAAVEQVRATPISEWNAKTLAPFLENTDPDIRGLPKKLIYGSDYPFREPSGGTPMELEGVDILASHARGGLSNVWGANLFPFLAQDIDDWPIGLADLDPYYRAVTEYVDLSATDDELSELFPIHATNPFGLRASRQAEALLQDLRMAKERMHRAGFSFGRSRLAVRGEDRDGQIGCVHCGLCLYGCPYGLIYSSAMTLTFLESQPGFRYVPDMLVERIDERRGEVSVTARNLRSGVVENVRGERVFVGCGAVGTTRLLLESMYAFDTEVTLQDSQYFLAPFVRFARTAGVLEERLYTLSQLCLELIDPKLSRRSIHLLVYTYNDLYRRALDKAAGRLAGVLKPVLSEMLGRLVVIQGYFHSDDSARIAVRLERREEGKRLVLSARHNPRTRPLAKAVLKRLAENRRSFRGAPVPFMTRIAKPGKSYHAGGSFPMRVNPGGFESDVRGIPTGFSRVHLIDASCFPSIPATNVTFTIMANASRIAAEAAEGG